MEPHPAGADPHRVGAIRHQYQAAIADGDSRQSADVSASRRSTPNSQDSQLPTSSYFPNPSITASCSAGRTCLIALFSGFG